jgi:hypothetical protein
MDPQVEQRLAEQAEEIKRLHEFGSLMQKLAVDYQRQRDDAAIRALYLERALRVVVDAQENGLTFEELMRVAIEALASPPEAVKPWE